MAMANAMYQGLYSVSRLFSYPDTEKYFFSHPEKLTAEARSILCAMHRIGLTRLQNEYVRLFINAMPEVPCPPYGSVYLEGTIVGKSTMRINGIYRRYGMKNEELADHIAVESEFLAWLSGGLPDSVAAEDDFLFLASHLKEWTQTFFSQVEEHDRLGCYKKCAQFSRNVVFGLPHTV
jgi:TorA maturation chaperone TorD